MSWKTVAFESLYSMPSRNGISVAKNQHDGETKIVNMGELFAADFLGDIPMRRIKLEERQLNANALCAGDLLFARRSLVASGAGKVAMVETLSEPTVFESSIIRVRLNQERAIPRFYAYWLRSPEGVDAIARLVTGTNVKGIRGSELRSIRVPLPSLDEQRRIASVLMAYDKLIENNRRQIALLEEAAQRLYKEWFVDLRFPGHENVDIVNGVPISWRRTTMGETCNAIGGGTPSTKNPAYWENGTIPWVTPSDVTANSGLFLPKTEKMITHEGLVHSSAKMLPAMTILMTSRASIGYFAICEQPVCTNQGFISCIPIVANSLWWLLYELRYRVDEIKSISKGSTFLEIGKTMFREMSVVLPDQKSLSCFENVAQNLFGRMVLLRKQLDMAREARDRLLPKLMSGEILG